MEEQRKKMANKGEEEGRKRKKRRKVDKEKIVLKQSELKKKSLCILYAQGLTPGLASL